MPALVWSIGRFGLGPGVASMAALLGLALLGLLALNLVEPTAAPAAPAEPAGAGALPVSGALPIDRRLVLLCALFGIGWLAQVAFLAQQLPLLVPKIGSTQATIAVAATTASSLLGRLALAGLDRPHRPPRGHCGQFRPASAGHGDDGGRRTSRSGSSPVAAWSARRSATSSRCRRCSRSARSAAAHYARVITRIWSVGQVLYAFGPIGAGLPIASGASTATLLACMACQLVAAALCAARPRAL